MRSWSQKSQERLNTCHSDLQLLANEVLSIHDCSVVYGHRPMEDQNRLFAEGKSKKQWPNSKHNQLPSIAIDLAPYVPGVGMWDMEYSLYFAGLVLGTADMLHKMGTMMNTVRWGGNWSSTRDRNWKLNSFYDGLHFELLNG
jgi:peptidoglycan L-alanyl-D-glutamate endopeptidase CwlK